MTHPQSDVEIDARGLRCPEPLMVVRNKLMDMAAGQVLKVTATDNSTTWDFPKFCKFMQHELLQANTEGEEYVYWIRKDGNKVS